MKRQAVKSAVDPATVRAAELSVLFAQAGWELSTQNFVPRPFVMWCGSFWSAAGSPPGDTCHSTCVQTEAELIAWLESFKAKPEPVDADLKAMADLQFDVAPFTEPERPPLPSPPADSDRVEGLGFNDEAESPDPRDEELERLRAENVALKERLDSVDVTPLPPNPTETKLSDYGAVGDGVSHIPDEIRDLMEEGESLSAAKRRLTELLWVELAELKNLRGVAGEDLKREAEIERLLGLFARLGEI